MKRHQFEIAGSVAAIILLGGCSAFQPQAKLEIRSVESGQRGSEISDPLAEGRGLLALGQNANAISAFRNALRENPNSGDAYNGLAIAYDRIGRQDLAQRYFELAVSVEPENVRYRGNLARLFERTGQLKLAMGLIEVPVRHGESVPEVEKAKRVSIAPLKPPQFVAVVQEVKTLSPPSPVEIALPALAELEVASPLVLTPETQVAPSDPQTRAAPVKAAIVPAVYRPTAAMTIRPAAIETRNLPKPGPRRDPFMPTERQPADLPRQAVMPFQREGIRLERISLGEVRLVTKASTPKLAWRKADDFNSFGVRLATWLPAAIAVERQGDAVRLAESPTLKEAIARAQIEKAIDNVTADSTEIAEIQTFTYAFFHDESLEEVSLAAL